MKAKFCSQIGQSFYPMFENWACVNEPRSVAHVCEIFFSSNCSKFAVECDWNRKISQNIQNFGFFVKKWMGFPKKVLIFFKIAKGSKFALLHIEWFYLKMSFPP